MADLLNGTTIGGNIAYHTGNLDPLSFKGMTENEKINFNNLMMRQVEDDYNNSRTALGYNGGFYDIFADESKIASSSQVVVSTLDGGYDNGKVKLDGRSWDVTTATFDGKLFSVNDQEPNPTDIAFSTDGTKMYIVGTSNEVNPYTLSTPWDVTSATFDGTPFNVSAQDSGTRGIAFKPDGTKMYIVGVGFENVNPYTLSTPWDVTSATFDGTPFNVSAQDSDSRGIIFKPDGTKMYIVGSSGNEVNPYTLSTPWDVTTATFDGTPFSVGMQEINPRGIIFKPDGTKMYIVGSSGNEVNPYTLSTPWDVTTATFDGTPFSVVAQDTNAQGIAFSTDGTKMYIVGWDLDEVNLYTLSTPWDVTTATFDGTTFSVGAQETSPTSIAFKPDGTKMYMVGTANDTVYQYTTGLTEYTTTLSVTISDGTNTVVVDPANFDTEVDCSALTSRTLTATWNLGTSDTSFTPTLNNYALYFTD